MTGETLLERENAVFQSSESALRKISHKWCWRRKTADLNFVFDKNPNEAMNISCIVNGVIRKTQHLQKDLSFFLKAGIPVGMWELLVQMATLCREPVY